MEVTFYIWNNLIPVVSCNVLAMQGIEDPISDMLKCKYKQDLLCSGIGRTLKLQGHLE